ncbi:hypothetical protein HHK36_025130 [Tetracentron sinense]|uniref:Remorin C-terminal domain-containing protein n=1 Tax=Tetracentron sinense TaxID=13715 RepID=A0A835D4R6_TETSI|nr:hypothetical protein HHK36_025130 [Tetracentron sinense]
METSSTYIAIEVAEEYNNLMGSTEKCSKSKIHYDNTVTPSVSPHEVFIFKYCASDQTEKRRMRSAEDKGCFNYGSTQEISSSSSINFEFHRGNGTNRGSHHRNALSKPTPSKWDDAQKWLVGLSRGEDRSHTKSKPRNSNADDRRLIAPVPQKEQDSSSSGEQGSEDGSQVHATIIQDEGETKKVDCIESFWRINKPSEDSSSAIRSICVRDMGTDMTPIASQEPSRTGTPLRATTPVACSPISSRSSTPGRCRQGVQAPESYQTALTSLDSRREDVNISRACRATRWSNREGEESNACKVFENQNSEQTRTPNPLETQAMAWDEAERAKYMARWFTYILSFENWYYNFLKLCIIRYKREEVNIQAWENHEKRKAEIEMKRMEAKAERLKSRAQERLANKLAATTRIAEEKRTSAETKLNEQAVRTSERADYIRRTGHLPASFSFKLPSFCW